MQTMLDVSVAGPLDKRTRKRRGTLYFIHVAQEMRKGAALSVPLLEHDQKILEKTNDRGIAHGYASHMRHVALGRDFRGAHDSAIDHD